MATQINFAQQTLASFDWQWANLPSGDFMPGDPWFDANAAQVLAHELCAIDPSWFQGKRVLDAGCGQGRWTRALLDLGAEVTAIDFSQAGLERTRLICGFSERLRLQRVNLLDLPLTLAAQRFDLVFSFGVLHHTGDTWSALSNIAKLVDEGGALFLYLYGVDSWNEAERSRIERTRVELAGLSFDQKIGELKNRFPGDDPHQLFDLLSPVINDRVHVDEVMERVKSKRFVNVDRTIASTEVYLRATRAGFPEESLLRPVLEKSMFAAEMARRDALRRGGAFEDKLREALAPVPARSTAPEVVNELRRRVNGSILDASLPPDRVPAEKLPGCDIKYWDGPSMITPRLEIEYQADAVLSIGAALGACRNPEAMVAALWSRVRPGGVLVVELSENGFAQQRSLIDKLLDKRADVPAKLGRLLERRSTWCSGEGLYALGGNALLNPISFDDAAAVLHQQGAHSIERCEARPGSTLLIAESK